VENLYDHLAKELGAAKSANRDVFTVYVPNKNRKNDEIENHPHWEQEISRVLAGICGGCTLQKSRGVWHENGVMIHENTTIIYSYIMDDQKFLAGLHNIRDVLHAFGRDTDQAAVAFEFNSVFYTISFPHQSQMEGL
jgi:hypothetical protein